MISSVFNVLDNCGTRRVYGGDPEPNYEDDEHWITLIFDYLNYISPNDRLNYESFINDNKGES